MDMLSYRRNRKPSALLVALTLLVAVATVAGCAPATATPEVVAVPTQAPPTPEPTVATTEGEGAGEDLNYSPDIPDPEEPVVVTFASWVGGGEWWQNLAEQFHAIHPNITIEFQDVPFEEIRTKLLTQVAANNPPDVAYVDASTTGEFASRNALVAMDDFIAMSKAVNLDDYVEAFMLSASYEGKVYGLPIDGESTGLFYRTDLFAEAGIDGPPTTWNELREYAQKLTIPDKKQYGYILFAPEAAYYWYPFLWQAGGDTLAQDGVDVIWDSDAGLRAGEFYVGLREFSPPDFLNSNSWDGRVAFAEGTVAMYMAGAWFAGVLQNEFPDINGKWATAPLPEDERCATTIAGDNLVIFKASQHAEAAWKWVEFVSAPQNMALLNLGTPDAPTTLLPPRTSLLEDPATFEANPILVGFAENMKCAVVSTVVQPRWGEMEAVLNDALARAIYGEVDASTALIESAQEAEALLQQ
jgi:ABC-type glycerol-3-phosphate transport system substrate-binding protein